MKTSQESFEVATRDCLLASVPLGSFISETERLDVKLPAAQDSLL